MKSFISLLFILGFSSIISTQNEFQKMALEILPTSKLSITGDTNIRDFKCVFNPNMLPSNNVIGVKNGDNKILFKNAILKLDNRGFNCGNKAINRDFHSLLKTSEYPKIVLELKKISFISSEKVEAEGLISIAGKSITCLMPVEIIEAAIPQYNSKLILNIKDFNLEPPKKALGLIVVKEDIEISFSLNVLGVK